MRCGSNCFVQLQRLSLDFYARLGSGDILARFSTDMASLETAITWGLASLILNSLTIVVAAILLFTLEWRLALLTVTLERSGFTELLKRAPQLHESLVQTYLSRLTAPG